jgi:DNA-binding CsgD family transcriptional regulator
LDHLLGLVDRLYAAPGSADGWRDFLADLCAALDATAGSFVSHNLSRHEAAVGVTARTPAELMADYLRGWGAHDPWAYSQRWRKLAPGQVALGEWLIPRAELRRTPFFNECSFKYDTTSCLATKVEEHGGKISFLTLNRGEATGSFDAEHVALLQALMPHLQRALQVHRRLAQAERITCVSLDSLDRLGHAVFVLDAGGRVAVTNRAADELVARHDGVGVVHGELEGASAAATTRLRLAIASALRVAHDPINEAGRALWLPRPSGQSPWRVVVSSLPAGPPCFGLDPGGAIVFVNVPGRRRAVDATILQAQFDLTGAEARLVATLSEGHDLGASARRLGITVGTARTRLKRVFQKTGVHSQAQLMRRVLVSQPLEL